MLWVISTLLMSIGCTNNDGAENGMTVELECGGNGHVHGDHCDCNPGFELSADENSCVPEPMRQTPDRDEPETGVDMEVDAGMEADAGMDGEAAPDNRPQPLNFVPTAVRASTGTADDGTRIWALEAMQDGTRLRLEIYASFGGPTAPDVVPLTETETNYATCGTCLVLQTGCVAHNDHFDCERTFMPLAMGAVQLDSIGASADDRLAGEVRDIWFQEVTIGDGFQTRPVADGDRLRLDTWPFDAAIEAAPEPECSGHGHMHGNSCHCDPGYRTDPENPSRCIPA